MLHIDDVTLPLNGASCVLKMCSLISNLKGKFLFRELARKGMGILQSSPPHLWARPHFDNRFRLFCNLNFFLITLKIYFTNRRLVKNVDRKSTKDLIRDVCSMTNKYKYCEFVTKFKLKGV